MIHQSQIYADKFGTAAMRQVWAEHSMVQSWLDLEGALAWAQGELGVIPPRAAQKIVKNCSVDVVTPEAVAAWSRRTGHVIVSLVKSFRDAVPDAGELFHFGPTTQDILDTGLTLQIREALKVLVPSLMRLHDTLTRQAQKYKRTVMAGRSEGQLGSPITLGYKIAVMASEVLDHIARLSQCAERLMYLTLFGATGVQSSFCHISDPKTTARMVALVGKRLGLSVPPICMHHRTDRFAELGCVLAGILSTLGEMGMELRDLQRSEVGEVAEPWSSEQHSSSTMPQKQNPEIAEWLEGLAKLGRGYAISLLDIQQQHERDISRLPPELSSISNLFLHCAAAVESANAIFGGLQVFDARMRENLFANGRLILAEAAMLLLAKKSGKKVWAHQLCHDIAMDVAKNGGDFLQKFCAHSDVARYIGTDDVKAMSKPDYGIGTAVTQVEKAAATGRIERKRVERSLARTVFARGIAA
jgi:adenylosuccinate lyase